MAKKKEDEIPLESQTIEPGASEAKPEEPETFEIPEDLREKSQEELAKMYVETRKKLGEQGKDWGEKARTLEDKIGALEAYRQQAEDERRLQEMYQPPQAGYQPQPQPEDKPTFDYEHPFASVESYLQQRERRQAEQTQVTMRQRAINEGKYSYQQGRNFAYRDEPELYRGIEREVEQRVYQTYAPFANQGISVKEFVGDPAVWRKAAQNVRLDRGEYDQLRPSKAPPMRATQTEIPSSTKPATTELPGQFDLETTTPDMIAFDKAMADAGGLKVSPEERKKILKSEQDRMFSGERW